MRYKILCEVGHRYFGEDLRETRMAALQREVTDAIVLSDDFRKERAAGPAVASNVPAGKGRVAALRDFHSQQQKNVTRNDELAADVVRIRKHLRELGAWVSPTGKIRWDITPRSVVYDHDLESQAATRLTARGGVLLTAAGKPFDTTDLSTNWAGKEHGIYVMSGEGNFHVSTHKTGHRHHSSLLAGRSVAGAGELKVKAGRLEWISNKSGHYHPDPFQMTSVLHRLNGLGVPLTFGVGILQRDTSVRTMSVDDFMTEHGLDDESFEAAQVQKAYERWLTDDFTLSTWITFIFRSSSVPPGIYNVGKSPMERVSYAEFAKIMADRGAVPEYLRSGKGR